MQGVLDLFALCESAPRAQKLQDRSTYLAPTKRTRTDLWSFVPSSSCTKTNRPECRTLTISHRRQDDHDCPAARDYTVRSDAADARKVKAAETLSKHFPSHPAKEIAKPTAHTRDLKRPHPSTSSLAPDLGHPPDGPAAVIASSPLTALPSTVGAEGSGEKIPKSKQTKLFDLHLRKLRIGAKPLDSRQRPDLPRRFFEIKHGVTESDTVTGWQGGKALPGLDKVWMHEVSAVFRDCKGGTKSDHAYWQSAGHSSGEEQDLSPRGR